MNVVDRAAEACQRLRPLAKDPDNVPLHMARILIRPQHMVSYLARLGIVLTEAEREAFPTDNLAAAQEAFLSTIESHFPLPAGEDG